MRLPFVSRRAYDDMWRRCQELEDAAGAAAEHARSERAEVRRLTDLLLDMKRDGFTRPAPDAPAPEPDKPLPEAVRDVLAWLRREGFTDDEIRTEERTARALLDSGMDDAAVAATLQHGATA